VAFPQRLTEKRLANARPADAGNGLIEMEIQAQ
jgi:hypothetical protein